MTPDQNPSVHILLVEGTDDKHVVRHLRERFAPTLLFDIHEAEGIGGLLEDIDPMFRVSGRETLGVIVDANARPGQRWKDLTDQFRPLDVHLPPAPVSSGAIIPGVPRVGVWVMPNNRERGALEDFVATMIPDDDPVWPLARDYICRVPADRLEVARSKAEIRAWLATREASVMGAAISWGGVLQESASTTAFISWLRELFD